MDGKRNMTEGQAERQPEAKLQTGAINERVRAFRARCEEYCRHGHDRLAAARFVVETADALCGPALDVGTGRGLLAIELARHGTDVVTIDIDDQDRELAILLAEDAGMAGRIAFEHGDASRLPYAAGHFGCAAMMDVLHHLADPVPVLREMARVVRPGGTVIVADFDEEGFELLSRVHRAEGREHPRTAATLPQALAELAQAGLSCTRQTNAHQHDIAVLRKGGA